MSSNVQSAMYLKSLNDLSPDILPSKGYLCVSGEDCSIRKEIEDAPDVTNFRFLNCTLCARFHIVTYCVIYCVPGLFTS